jgi:uncharacterized protein involved in exopolysaccharide biosynthesis
MRPYELGEDVDVTERSQRENHFDGGAQQGYEQVVPVGILLGNVLLAHRRLIAGVTIAATVVGIVYTLSRNPVYVSQASFLPRATTASTTPLAGLAAQFGVSTTAADGGHSPAFYVDLLRSRTILGAIADSIEAAGNAGVPSARQRTTPALKEHENLVERLRMRVAATASQKTSVVAVQATASSPAGAYNLMGQLIREVMRFDSERRQSEARAERIFALRRMKEAGVELNQSEQRLKEFLQGNRTYGNSPELQFEHDRLGREVMLRQQLYTSVAEAYEQARLEEVRDTPILTMIDEPELPAEPESRHLVRNILIACMLGLAAGVALAFFREGFSTAALQTDQVERFARLQADAAQSVRGFLRRKPASVP